MLPDLHLGFFNLPTFGLMLWCAAVVGAIVVDRGFKREKITADAVGMVAIALVAGILGAKVWHVLDSPSEFRTIGWGVLWDTAGFAWYGGMVFGILALVLQGLRWAIPALALALGAAWAGTLLPGSAVVKIVAGACLYAAGAVAARLFRQDDIEYAWAALAHSQAKPE